ncbi:MULTISPECIES: hypothetical protein [unclassified Mammaliicoccus]|uniref:hypothetical protein n=1 Tax=Mammaliicoccus TaxID=2803850 RepID=UPI001EFB6046|nr:MULTISPECIES: hypothetical protein [unclassified Mammaliicoccus]
MVKIEIWQWLLECIKDVPKSYVTGLFTTFIIMFAVTLYHKIFIKFDKIRKFFNFIKLSSIINNKQVDEKNNNIIHIKKIPKFEVNYKSYKVSKHSHKESNDDNEFLIICIISGVVATVFLGEQLRENYLYVQKILSIILNVLALLGFAMIFKIVLTRNTYKTTINFLIITTIYILFVNYINNLLPEIVAQIPKQLNIFSMEGIAFTAYTLVGIMVLLLALIFIIMFVLRIIALVIVDKYMNSISRFIIIKTGICEKTTLCLIFIIFLTGFSYLLTTGTLYEWVSSFQNI